ncbi:MFS transporter [Bacillus sp. HMF5848]|uniref:MFS transporter n=1 Tax=Bacillus sp. HMF5848 TaxID=2495421 RepID=UPI000F7AEC8E|nr:MFS transporter [Bacillus sp. HMF5848]RSK26354.1 MFS transporter [Bacillus sp. HMF5848]
MTHVKTASLLLIITGTFVACNIYSLIPIYLQIGSDFSSNIDSIVPGSSSFTFSYAVGLLCFGSLGGKIGKKKIIVFGMLAASVTSILVSFTTEPITLIAARALQGFMLGSFAPNAFALTFDILTGTFRTFVIALINTGFLVAGILGQIISVWIEEATSWSGVFTFYAVLYLILFILLSVLLPKDTSSQTNTSLIQNVKIIYNKRPLILAYLISFCLLQSVIIFYESLNRLGLHLDWDSSSVNMIRIVGLTGAVLSFGMGALIERFGVVRVLQIGAIFGLISFSPMMFTTNKLHLALLSIFFIAAISILIPTIVVIVGQLGEHARATAVSIYSFVLLSGASLGPLWATLFTFKITIVMLIIMYCLLLWLPSRLKNQL